MEITHIHWSGKPIIGGIERHLDSLIPSLNENRIPSKLICGNNGGLEYQNFFDGLNYNKDLKIDDFTHFFKELFKEPHIVHIHNGHVISPEKTAMIFDFLKQKDQKVVLSIHNLDVDKESQQRIINLPFDGYITYSPFMNKSVKSIFNKSSEVLPCCVNIDYTPIRETTKTHPRILQPTRFSKWKGSILSLECISNLLDQQYSLEFIHGGCKNLLYGKILIPEDAKKWISEDKIQLRDYSFDEINEEIKKADIILHPTIGTGEYGEPFSLCCLESMLLKKPIIASDSGFVPSLLGKYSRKQIVQSGDRDDLLKALKRWLIGPIPPLSYQDNETIQTWKNYNDSGVLKHIQFYREIRDI